jgi:hypothetical protein
VTKAEDVAGYLYSNDGGGRVIRRVVDGVTDLKENDRERE